MTRQRTVTSNVLQILLVWLPTVSVFSSWLLSRSAAPDVLATRWSGESAGGWVPTGVAFVSALALAAATAGFAGLTERRRVWIAAGFSAFIASVWLVLLFVNMQPQPELGGWGLLTPFAFLYGGLPAVCTHMDNEQVDSDSHVDVSPTWRPGARDATVSPVICSLSIVAGISTMIAAWAALCTGTWNGLEISLGVVTLLAAEFAVVRVSRNARGIAVFGLLPGIPLYSIRSNRIVSIEHVWIRPLDWGGWGYRISPAGTGLILRAGPGVIVRSTSGRAFTFNTSCPERSITEP